jgi:hypothetical protein
MAPAHQYRGLTCVSHIRKDIAVLLLEGGYHRHQGFDKPRPSGTLGPKAAFAPQDHWADRPLGRIAGRLHPFDMHKGPQGDQPTVILTFELHLSAKNHFYPLSECQVYTQT